MMMTSLSGDRLVSKDDGRIRFRGRIDSLEAETIEAQVLASSLGEQYYCNCLGEVLDCLRNILAAEVKGTPFPPPDLFGLSADELHRQSHAVTAAFGFAGHPLQSYTQGPMAVRLNTLRAHIREVELLSVQVFCPPPIDPLPDNPPPGSPTVAATADGPPPVAALPDTAPPVPAAPPRREDLPHALNRLSSALYWLFCRKVKEDQ
jgi:ethanolamine utilization cobalamin adenosyltransferase